MRKRRSGTAYAPYNFVPFPKKVKVRYANYEQLPKHDGSDSERNLLSGELTFDIEAKTPILVAQGNEDPDNRRRTFNRDVFSRYEIPGSTLRGLIRQAVGIIGHSDLTKEVSNRNNRVMYRGLADSKSKGLENRGKYYSQLIENVLAGYIRMREEKGEKIYEILPAEKINGRTFSYVREQQLHQEGVFSRYNIHAMYTRDILKLEEIGRPKSPGKKIKIPSHCKSPVSGTKEEVLQAYEEMLNEYREKLRTDPRCEQLEKMYIDLYGLYYEYLGMCQKKDYKPYFLCNVEVYITANPEKGTVSYSFDKKGRSSRRCALMASGFIPKKQAHYVIHPLKQNGEPIILSEDDVSSYELDLELKGKRVPASEFYNLPKPGELRPCFYTMTDGKIYFGYTPNMRVFYKHKICHGLPQYNHEGIDYVEAMFGFSGKKFVGETEAGEQKAGEQEAGSIERSYAGRLMFRSAIAEGKPEPLQDVQVIPGQPKVSAVAMYIQQDVPELLKTMNDDDFKWRGIKQYWLKDWVDQLLEENNQGKDKKGKNRPKNHKVFAYLSLLPQGTLFRASIRFDRLHRDELGLLLAALTWPKHQTIGMGKPYGAGCVVFSNLKLLLDQEQYDLNEYFANPYREVSQKEMESYIQAFQDEMKPFCDDVLESKPVRTYLAMREKVYDHIEKGYMELSGNGNGKPTYQSMFPLPRVEELLFGEK